MKVFVVTQSYDYEGEAPIGVAAELSFAQKMAEEKAECYGHSKSEWAKGTDGWEMQTGYGAFVIREEEVIGGEELVPMCPSLKEFGRCGA